MKRKINNGDDKHNFVIEDDGLFKVQKGSKIPIANFHTIIQRQLVLEEEGGIKGRRLEIVLKMAGREITFTIPSDEFVTREFEKKILQIAGSSAIIYRSGRDLQVATQEFSRKGPEILTRTHGFLDGTYYSEGMVITPSGIVKSEDIHVDVSGGNFSRYIGFVYPDDLNRPQQIGTHLLKDFLELKSHRVMYPLMAHIVLAPFVSEIFGVLGREKVVIHLEGFSGSGKTFLCTLAESFFGDFEMMERIPAWSWTPNAIEAEGYHFRDVLFMVDDYKASLVPQQSVVRIIQGYSQGHGRARLNSSQRLQKELRIRGLLLSNGEDFALNVESVSGRTLRIRVEPDKNTEAGDKCHQNRRFYRMFMPGLIHYVISLPDWKSQAKAFVNEKIRALSEETSGLSNGLRVASNWGLNALGFDYFAGYLVQLGLIDTERKQKMTEEYLAIVRNHVQEQIVNLQGENPVRIFFEVLAPKLAMGSVAIWGFNSDHPGGHGRFIGQVKDQSVMVFPDEALGVLAGHFRGLGQRLPFSRNSLRDALAQEGLIQRPKDGRWTAQFKGTDGKRHNGWEFELQTFKNKVEI